MFSYESCPIRYSRFAIRLALEFFLTGPYTIDAGRHAPVSLLVIWLRQDGRFEEWPVDEPPDPLSPLLEGDILCFLIGHGVAHHVGLVVSPAGDFVHCLRGHGVIQSTLKDPTYRNLLTNHFRPRWASVPPTRGRRMGNGGKACRESFLRVATRDGRPSPRRLVDGGFAQG